MGDTVCARADAPECGCGGTRRQHLVQFSTALVTLSFFSFLALFLYPAAQKTSLQIPSEPLFITRFIFFSIFVIPRSTPLAAQPSTASTLNDHCSPPTPTLISP